MAHEKSIVPASSKDKERSINEENESARHDRGSVKKLNTIA
jgi:hypothetical protein